MHPFEYKSVTDPQGAVQALTPLLDARYLAGGTTLVDLMKLNVETPSQLIDINPLPLNKIEPTATGGVRIGAMVRNSDLALRRDHRAELSGSFAGASFGRVGAVAKHGIDGRQSASADPLLLLPRYRLSLQQA